METIVSAVQMPNAVLVSAEKTVVVQMRTTAETKNALKDIVSAEKTVVVQMKKIAETKNAQKPTVVVEKIVSAVQMPSAVQKTVQRKSATQTTAVMERKKSKRKSVL